mgnify:CR=1 FL=1
MFPLRSRVTTVGRNASGARALWRATGTQEHEFGKPIVAIVNSYTQFVPGHVHLHNMGQLMIAAILIHDIRIFYYLPVLMISGTVAGIAIGIASEMVIRRVKLI